MWSAHAKATKLSRDAERIILPMEMIHVEGHMEDDLRDYSGDDGIVLAPRRKHVVGKHASSGLDCERTMVLPF